MYGGKVLDMSVLSDTSIDPLGRPPRHDGPQRVVALPRWVSAAAGAVSAAAALGVSEALTGLFRPIPSLWLAVGNAVVDLVAGTPLKSLAIALFGTNDKTALIYGTAILVVGFGALLGLVARRSWAGATAGFVGFGLLGVLATTVSPLDSSTWAALSAVVTVGVGVLVLRHLHSRGAVAEHGGGRREFLRAAAVMAFLAGGTGAAGHFLTARRQTSASRAAVVLPQAQPAVTVPPGSSFDALETVTPLFTPNRDFYRIDTALMAPVVELGDWTLEVHGMVDRVVTLTYDDLQGMDQFESDMTIACVSNEVGGGLIGNARWQGVRLADVLDLAGVNPQAGQIVGRSVDGWTAGFPTQVAFDGRDAMIAVGMNGQPLPIDHGFPARLIVPGLYGYVSATKWLQDIELTTWEAFDSYWIPRGWAKEGPIKTQSRIDVPAARQQVSAGQAVVAGVAWAQQRGVAMVEVSIDDGPWQQAELAEELNIDTWRQWRYQWDAVPGEHRLRVRATDTAGRTQSEQRVPVGPDGAEGYHTRTVQVS